jgi:tRNA(adenine34) deaminase
MVTGKDAHIPLMYDALTEGVKALETADVPVGALVVSRDGQVIGRGRNRREVDGDPTAHAEMVALRAAANYAGTWRLDGTTLVVTMEPCAMCAGALVMARVQRLVYGATDAKAGAVGSLWDIVRDRRVNHRIEVISGVLADECGSVVREFFAAQRL